MPRGERTPADIYDDLANFDPTLLEKAITAHNRVLYYSPTDAKEYYKASLAYKKAGRLQEARNLLEKTLDLRPNYQEAKKALLDLE